MRVTTDNSMVYIGCVSKASVNKVNLLNSDTERETKFEKRQQFSTTKVWMGPEKLQTHT